MLHIEGMQEALHRAYKPKLVLGAPAKNEAEFRERRLTAAAMNPQAFGGSNFGEKTAPERTSEAMLQMRAVINPNAKQTPGKLRFARGKLIGGKARLFRP